MFQLQSELNVIICIEKRFAITNSEISLLASVFNFSPGTRVEKTLSTGHQFFCISLFSTGFLSSSYNFRFNLPCLIFFNTLRQVNFGQILKPSAKSSS